MLYCYLLRFVVLCLVSTFAGTGQTGNVDGPASAATFSSPFGIAAFGNGDLVVSQITAFNLRQITAATMTVSTLAGSKNLTSGVVDGKGTSALFNQIYFIASNSARDIFVCDTGNNLIRKISSDGTVTTLAGSRQYASVNGVGTMASFKYPLSVALNTLGDIFVSEFGNLIRKISSSSNRKTKQPKIIFCRKER